MSEQKQTLTIQQAIDLAVQHHNAGRLPEAEKFFQQILQTNPDHPEAHFNLGYALQDLGKLEEAVACYHKALAIKLDYPEAHNNLGNVLKNLGKLEKALASYEKALALKPDYPEANNNRGVALRDLGRLEDAVASYCKALAIKQDYFEAHNNLGNALKDLGKPEEAVASYHKALNLKPDLAEAHNNLGNALRDLGKPEEAISSYQKALNLKPDYVNAHNNLGLALRELGRLEDALQIFESIDTPECYAHVLECLFALGEYDKFYEKQTASTRNNEINTRVAAINAFASHQLNRSDPHPFCPTPLKFVRVCEPLGGVDDADGFLCDLMDDLQSREAIWEPPGKTTRHGFQTMSNLFKKPYGRLVELDRIIKDTIENYRFEFSSENCDFIKLFPETLTLSGWFIRLIKGGHQAEHIHSGAWLSGIFYLQMPKCTDQEEGSIELGLWGYDYPILNKSYPKNRFYPKNGSIILFPSSLFHRTIPFHSDEERMSIAFDLRPTQTWRNI